jgi:hypothetical protein
MIDSVSTDHDDSILPVENLDVVQTQHNPVDFALFPRTPVRIEKYLKPKASNFNAFYGYTTPARTSTWRERKVARKSLSSTPYTERSSYEQPKEQASFTVPPRPSTSSVVHEGDLSAIPPGAVPRRGECSPVVQTSTFQFANVTTALDFDQTLPEVHVSTIDGATDTPSTVRTPDSLEGNETCTATSGIYVSPRFFDSLPVKLEELLSSSGDSSEENPASLLSKIGPSLSKQTLGAFSLRRSEEGLSELGEDAKQLRPTLPTVQVEMSGSFPVDPIEPEDVQTLRAVKWHKCKLLRRTLAFWHGGVCIKKDQALLFRRNSLLRKAFRGLVLHTAIVKEINKMAVWKHTCLKTKIYLDKWKRAVSAVHHVHLLKYFTAWRHSQQLKASLRQLENHTKHSLLFNALLLWRKRLQLSLKETAVRQLWNGRIVSKVFGVWRVKAARRRSALYGERVAELNHLLMLKRDAFLHWRGQAVPAKTARLQYERKSIRRVFYNWRLLGARSREELRQSMKSACALRESVLMRKGYRKWLLKFRLKVFRRRHSYELCQMAFEVWKERTRSCMSLTVTSVSVCEQVAMVKSFEKLFNASRESARKRKMAALAYRKILIRRCMVAWRQYIYQRMLRVACDHFVAQNNRKTLQMSFDQWTLAVQQRMSSSTITSFLSRSTDVVTLRRAFAGWVAVVRGKRAVTHVQGKIAKLEMQRLFFLWRRHFDIRQNLHHLMQIREQSILILFFGNWRRLAQERASLGRAEKYHHQLNMEKCFRVWQVEYSKSVAASRCKRSRDLKLLRHCLFAWRRQVEQERRLGVLNTHVVQRQQEQLKNIVMCTWRQKTFVLRNLRSCQHKQNRRILQQCFTAWQETTSSSLLHLQNLFLSRLQQAVQLEGARFPMLPNSHNVGQSPSNAELVRNSEVITSTPRTSEQYSIGSSVTLQSVELVKRNLFNSSPSAPPLQPGAYRGVAPTGDQELAHPLSTRTQASTTLSSVGYRAHGVHSPGGHLGAPGVIYPGGQLRMHDVKSPGGQLRILEESPSKSEEGRGQLSGQSDNVPSVVVGYDKPHSTHRVESDFRGLSPVRPFLSDSFKLGASSSIREDVSSVSRDVSFISVSFCECVSEEIRAELLDLDLEVTEGDISDGELVSDSEDAALIWTDQSLSKGENLETVTNVDLVHSQASPVANQPLLQTQVARKLIRVVQMWRQHPCSKVLYHWHRYTVWYRRLRRAYKSVVRSRMRRVCRECLAAWIDWHRSSASRYRDLQMMVKYSEQRRATFILEHWRERVEQVRRTTAVRIQQAEDHHHVTILKRMVEKWKISFEMESSLRKAVQISNKQIVASVFHIWKESAASNPEAGRKAMEVCSRSLTLQAFALWKERFFFVQARKMSSVEFQTTRELLTMSRCFQIWRERCRHECARQSELIPVSDRFTSVYLLSNAFHKWRNSFAFQLGCTKTAETKGNCVLVRRTFMKWKLMHLSRSCEFASAVHYHQQKVVLVVFQTWRRRCCDISERNTRNYLTALKMNTTSATKAAFGKWRRCLVSKETHKTQLLGLLENKWLIYQCNKVFSSWKLQYDLRLLARKHSRVSETVLILKYWKKWKQLVQDGKAARVKFGNLLLLRTWRKWRLAFVQEVKIREFAEKETNDLMLKVFVAWRLASALKETSPRQEEMSSRQGESSSKQGESSSRQAEMLSQQLEVTLSTYESLDPHPQENLLHTFRIWKWRTKLLALQRLTC